ncbi:618_t:CDS:2 [Entrophospora sp. SA101]|nr:618_t:CDS:2 [Entrophospora sp. SA101]CAJ0871503.1 1291_t:CDS:2 [Entrophospora sp. SA101]
MHNNSNFFRNDLNLKKKQTSIKTITSLIGLSGVTIWYIHNKKVIHADTSSNLVKDSIETIEEPESKIRIPACITLYDGSKAVLIGMGTRRVSFLNINVYIVGMYIREKDIEILKKWKGFDKEKFLSSSDESVASMLLDQPIEISIRIEPIRNTNGQHLRDGFARALNIRLQDEIVEAIKIFKTKFSKSIIRAGTALVLTRLKDGGLRMDYEGKEMGIVYNDWLSKNIFMGYLSAKHPISIKAKESIAEGFENLLLK